MARRLGLELEMFTDDRLAKKDAPAFAEDMVRLFEAHGVYKGVFSHEVIHAGMVGGFKAHTDYLVH